MSLTTSEMTPADIAAVTKNNGYNDGGWAGGWSSWIILFLIFGMFGFGGYGGFGGFGGGQGGYDASAAMQRGFDNSAVISKLDGITNGLCDGFYATNTAFGNLNNTLCQGFSGVNTALVQQGYESRLATLGVQNQLSQCCCDTREAIQENTTQGVINTNAIQQQINQCCCNNEKAAMQTRFDAAQYNCSTLQAIDKMGDRIIDYLTAKDNQNLRDENQALRLAASQSAQNNYLISQLRPSPVPAYDVPNPYAYGGGYGCCGYGCGNRCA